MVSIQSIYEQKADFFEDAPYIELKELIDMDIEITDYKQFTNDKGDGVAFKVLTAEGEVRSIVTHSIGLVKLADNPLFLDAMMGGDVVTGTVRQGKSKKTGRYFYYIG